MKKLKLKALGLGARELLSREQLRNVLGGSSGDCNGDKVSVCEKKEENDPCCFKWNGNEYYGKCKAFAPTYTLHCSDLN